MIYLHPCLRFFLVAFVFTSIANADTLMFPAALANTEGINFNSQGMEAPVGPWPAQESRAHAIYDSRPFAQKADDLGVDLVRITEFNLRPDETAAVDSIIGFDDLELSFAVTSAATEEISHSFAENLSNLDSKLVSVYDGPWQSRVLNPIPEEGARPFDFKVVLTTPFEYDPRQGNLFVEWNIGMATHPNTRFDYGERLQIADQATTFALAEAPTAGRPFTVVTEFQFEAVPEPTISLQSIGLLIGLAGTLRSKRSE